MCSGGMKMGVRWLFVGAVCACAAVFLVNSAPASLTSAAVDNAKQTDLKANAAAASLKGTAAGSHEKPLIRTKRAEEILYGNHQNAPRVKKSDPGIGASDDEANAKSSDVIKNDDKNAIPETESEPALPEEEQEEESAKNDGLNLEDVPPSSPEADNDDYRRYEEDEDAEPSEGGDQDALRKKRSIRSSMMTAENMVANSNGADSGLVRRPGRAKRGADYARILREMMENDDYSPYPDGDRLKRVVQLLRAPNDEDSYEEDAGSDDYNTYYDYVEPVYVARAPVEQPKYEFASYPAPARWEETPSMEEEEEEEAAEEEEGPRDDGTLRQLVEKKAEEDAKERLIEYLLEAAMASERPRGGGEEEAGEEEGQRARGEEEYEEDPRTPLEYDEEAPAVMPVKRNTFYPYSYEPYGGRWGAMVPGSKRSANEFDRLYRLAEALNDEEDYEEKK